MGERLSSALAAEGPAAIPTLLRLYGGTAPELVEQLMRDETPWIGASERIARAAGDALVRMPDSALATHLDAACQPQASLQIRLAAVRLYGRLGLATGIAPCLKTAEELGPRALRSRSVHRTLGDALTLILAADDTAPEVLRGVLPAQHPELLSIVLESIERIQAPSLMPLLFDLLDNGSADEPGVMEAIATLTLRSPWAYDGFPAFRLRPFLHAASPRVAARRRGRPGTHARRRVLQRIDPARRAGRPRATRRRRLGACRAVVRRR